MRQLYRVLLAVLFLPSVALASPWLVDSGGVTLSYSTIFTSFDTIRTFDETEIKGGLVRLLSHRLGVQIGLAERWNVDLDLPFESVTLDGDAAASYYGLGDGNFGVTRGWLNQLQGDFLDLTTRASAKVPLSKYPVDRISALGDGQVDLALTVSAGLFYSALRLVQYVRADGGYRLRTGATPDEAFGYLEWGAILFQGFSLRLFANYVNALGGVGLMSPEFSALQTASGAPPFPQLAEDVGKAGVGLSWTVASGTSLSVFASQVVYVKNSSRDQSIGLSVSWEAP